jgi:hypothetical protein
MSGRVPTGMGLRWRWPRDYGASLLSFDLNGLQIILSESTMGQASVIIKNIEIYAFNDWTENCLLVPD